MATALQPILTKETDMKTLTLTLLALCLASCGGSGYPGPSDVTIIGNGTEACPKGDCPERDPNVRRDPK